MIATGPFHYLYPARQLDVCYYYYKIQFASVPTKLFMTCHGASFCTIFIRGVHALMLVATCGHASLSDWMSHALSSSLGSRAAAGHEVRAYLGPPILRWRRKESNNYQLRRTLCGYDDSFDRTWQRNHENERAPAFLVPWLDACGTYTTPRGPQPPSQTCP